MELTADQRRTNSEVKLFRMCPIWSAVTATTTTSSPSSTQNLTDESLSNQRRQRGGGVQGGGNKTLSSVGRSILPTRRRLKLEPLKHLYFPYEPGKQVRSAIRLKNTTKSHVAFKFQTTAPKSCYMRPPGGILAPGESLIATVFKFVEHPDNGDKQADEKSKVKFKIVSLKVKEGTEYASELFEEQKDHITMERILRVVFLDVERPNSALEKLERMLAEAEAELEARKKPPPDTGNKIVGEGLVIDEWKERRERYLARQQVEAADV